ncbi:MAG: Kelch repeat-containing protein, partial [Nitrospinaceae bacterium]
MKPRTAIVRVLTCLAVLAFSLPAAGLLTASPPTAGLGRWEVGPPVPSARTEVAAAAVQGRIYVIGGFGEKGVSGRVDVYDTAASTWSQASPLPQPLHHAAAVALGGKVYVVGGFKSGLWTPVNNLYRYDPKTDAWTEKAAMPTARGALAAGVMDGKLHAVGGAEKSFFRLKNTPAHEVYDPKTDHWSTLPPLPTARDHFTVSVFQGRLYAIGGRVDVNYNNNLDVNEAYDPETRQWVRLSPLPTARSGITSQVLGGRIFVFGGESGAGTFPENEAYDPVTGTWTAQAPMPEACPGLGSAEVQGRLHLLAGGPR